MAAHHHRRQYEAHESKGHHHVQDSERLALPLLRHGRRAPIRDARDRVDLAAIEAPRSDARIDDGLSQRVMELVLHAVVELLADEERVTSFRLVDRVRLDDRHRQPIGVR